MKYLLIALLVTLSPVRTLAQEHSLYADVGYTPGFSVTYNYKLAKHFGVGIGLHGYRIHRPDDRIKFTPGLFADMRLNIRPEKNNQFFLHLNLGADFYKQQKTDYRDSVTVYVIPHNNGFYAGLGFGYLRRMTRRGGGPYTSLKLISNWYTMNAYNIIAEEKDKKFASAYGHLVFSLGFKF